MQIQDAHLAPPQLIELIQYYVRHYSLDMKKVLCVDDYRFPSGVYAHKQRTLVLNFATMPKERYKFHLFVLDLVPSLWAVQICCMLYHLRKAIQYKQGMDHMSIQYREQDAMDWTYIEMLRLVGLDKNLFMPDKLVDQEKEETPMGIIGVRVRNELYNLWLKGGARVDAAGMAVKGAAELNRLRKFMKHEAVQELLPKIKDGKIGVKSSHWTFFSFYEVYIYVLDELCLQRNALRRRREKMMEVAKETTEKLEEAQAHRVKMHAATADNVPVGG